MSFQKRNPTLKRIQRLKHHGNEMTNSAGAISSTALQISSCRCLL